MEELWRTDPEIARAIELDTDRQRYHLNLIASENYASQAILEALGSPMTNKYAEGYSGKRYYGGCEVVDVAEQLAIDRAKALFGAEHANVQPHAGAQANMAAYFAFLKPGEPIMAMNLAHGGHLTHGSPVNFSGQLYRIIAYGVDERTEQIDYDVLARLAREHRPRIVVSGATAYPRTFDFPRLREICDEVGALMMVDMAHFAGLVAGGAHPDPVRYADVVTSTTHKTLRGPRGAMILSNEEDLAKKINSAVFPGLQGGPLMHIIAAKAVAFGEALRPEFRAYARAVVENAKALGEVLNAAGYDLVSGGTDTHLLLVDLRPKKLTGNVAEKALGRAHITTNKNGVPFDPEKPTVTSGIRLGSPAGTTRGFGIAEFRQIGRMIAEVLDGLATSGEAGNARLEAKVKAEAIALTERFPIYA